MTTPRTLADAWEDEQRPLDQRRIFMAGALVALQLVRAGVPPAQLLAECIQFGRVIGTPAEAARN
jgi:hypothetical protein